MNGLTPSPAQARPPDPPPPDEERRPGQGRRSGNCVESGSNDTGPGGDAAGLRFEFRIQPRESLDSTEHDAEDFKAALKREARALLAAEGRDVPATVTALQRDVCGPGLARPGNDVLSAIACVVLPMMGAKLGPKLEFDLSERGLSELLGIQQETASRKIEALDKAEMIEFVDEHNGSDARRWRVGPAWLAAALAFSPSSGHTTALTTSLYDGSAPARAEGDEHQQESENETKRLAVVRLEDGDYGAPDVFTPGQAQQGGLNDSARRIVVALEQDGPCSPGELARRIGCHPNTVTRVLDRLEPLGMIKRTRRRVELVPEAVERACESTRRRDYLRAVHRGERAEYAAMLERQEATAESERLAKKNREARRRGDVDHKASAFDQTPAPVEPPPRAPEARATVSVPVAQLVEIQQPPAATADWSEIARRSAARSSLPDPKVPEPTTRSRTIAPVADIAALRAWEQKHPDVTRNGTRRAPDGRRRRTEQKPPTCKHGEPRDECGRCLYADRDMGATTLGGRPLNPDNWRRGETIERTPLEVASEHAEIAERRRREVIAC